MKLTETLPFAKELLSHPGDEACRRPGAHPAPGDVILDAHWRIATESDAPVVATAAAYLHRFLKTLIGKELAGGETAPRIRLHLDPSLGANPETHRLRITPGQIEISGAGPAGVLQGVFRLAFRLRAQGGPFLPPGEEQRQPLLRRRIHRSPLSPFYMEELTGYDGVPFNAEWFSPGLNYPAYREEDAGPDSFYHDNLLLRMAEHGINGIWVRGALRHFARVNAFPEFGANADAILASLRRLCRRAARYGIQVYLFLNEPMGIPAEDPFWQRHPECKGSASRFKPLQHLCTSAPAVKEYLREAPRYIFKQAPELAGVILISASEYPSHCYSHLSRPEDPQARAELIAKGELCPRCAERTPQEVVGEVVGLIRDGVKAAKPEAAVIAWNWSWSFYEADPQRGVLERLPRDVIVMGDFERGEPAEAEGFAYNNDEYSIKVVGPSRRFTGTAAFQKERDLPVYAKVQIGTTHENPTVPYLPALRRIAEKYLALPDAGVSGVMSCWNFGNMPSLATEVANEFSWAPRPRNAAEGLLRVATRHFGAAAAPEVVAGWEQLSRAHDSFPGSIPVMYLGPISRGPAFPFVFERINRPFPNSWLLDAKTEGDRLDWTAPFGPEKVRDCYRAEAAAAAEGIGLLNQALAKTTGADRKRLEREIGVARFHRIQTVSAANVVDFLLTRDAFYAAKERAAKLPLLARLEEICRAEQENARAALPLLDADPRLGWHGEAYGYMIDREQVTRKLASLEKLLTERLPAEKDT